LSEHTMHSMIDIFYANTRKLMINIYITWVVMVVLITW